MNPSKEERDRLVRILWARVKPRLPETFSATLVALCPFCLDADQLAIFAVDVERCEGLHSKPLCETWETTPCITDFVHLARVRIAD